MGGKEVFECKNVPLLHFLYSSAGAARPGELTCTFFLKKKKKGRLISEATVHGNGSREGTKAFDAPPATP